MSIQNYIKNLKINKGGVIIMRDYEKQRLQTIIEAVKHMQKMKFDKYVILNNLDSMIEKLCFNASNDFIKCAFDIRQNVVLDKEIKQEELLKEINKNYNLPKQVGWFYG